MIIITIQITSCHFIDSKTGEDDVEKENAQGSQSSDQCRNVFRYLYLSMESYFQSVSLAGFAGWMRGQVQEELIHGMKFYDFVNERGGRVTLESIKKPELGLAKHRWQHLNIFCKHEQMVTDIINDLMDLAMQEQDHATKIFLQWFVSEQVEEEATVGEVVDKLRLIKNESSGLFFLDAEMSKRVFTLPE